MKAVVKARPEPGVQIAEVPEPQPGEDEILVRVEATSICGSDLAIYEWRDWVAERMQTPRVVGHEFCGTVETVGARVERVKPGDFIAAETHIVDGTCHQCLIGEKHVCSNVQILGFDRDGCFAELITIPAANAWITDRSMPVEVASIQEPSATPSTRPPAARFATRWCWSPAADRSGCSASPSPGPRGRRA